MRTSSMIISISAAILTSSAAMSDPVITFTNREYDDHGTGFGHVLNILAVQERGSEFGSVLRMNGEDVLGGDAKNTSQTLTVGEMLDAGVSADGFGLVFNINEPGSSPEVILDEFTLVFYDALDNVLFDATFNAADPLVLEPVDGFGTGQAGWLFTVDFSEPEADLFFSDRANRLGMLLPEGNPILESFAGPENFYVVPAPAGFVALIGLLFYSRRRRDPLLAGRSA